MNINEIKSMLGQMIIIGIRATNDSDVKKFFRTYNDISVGGIILYDQNVTTNPWSSHNILNPEQLIKLNRSLQFHSKTPLLIGIDQEGGNVNRLNSSYGFPNFSSWGELGKINDLNIMKNNSKNGYSNLQSAQLIIPIKRKHALGVELHPYSYQKVDLLDSLNSELINRTIVSTDNTKIKEESKRLGAEVVVRPKKLSGDKIGIEPAIQYTLDFLKKKEN